jgi:threonyl-tRNA synthetase
LKLIPYMVVVGERDAEAGTVSLRDRIEGDLGAMPFEAALAKLAEEVANKTIRQVVKTSAGLADKGAVNDY